MDADWLMDMQMNMTSPHTDLWRRGLLLRAISPANRQQHVLSTCGGGGGGGELGVGGVVCLGRGGRKGEADRGGGGH